MSYDICAEMEKMIALIAWREMVLDSNSNYYFALIDDGSADTSEKERLSIAFRTVFSTCKINENLLEFCVAMRGYPLMPYSGITPMFSCDAKLIAKSLLQ